MKKLANANITHNVIRTLQKKKMFIKSNHSICSTSNKGLMVKVSKQNCLIISQQVPLNEQSKYSVKTVTLTVYMNILTTFQVCDVQLLLICCWWPRLADQYSADRPSADSNFYCFTKLINFYSMAQKGRKEEHGPRPILNPWD